MKNFLPQEAVKRCTESAACLPGNFMPAYLTPSQPQTGFSWFYSPLELIYDRWEIMLLAAALLVFFAIPARLLFIFWSLFFTSGFLSANFTMYNWLSQLPSVYLILFGTWAMHRVSKEDFSVMNKSHIIPAAFIAGLGTGISYYAKAPVMLSLADIPAQVTGVLLLSGIMLLPGLWLKYRQDILTTTTRRKLPLFMLLAGLGELFRFFRIL